MEKSGPRPNGACEVPFKISSPTGQLLQTPEIHLASAISWYRKFSSQKIEKGNGDGNGNGNGNVLLGKIKDQCEQEIRNHQLEPEAVLSLTPAQCDTYLEVLFGQALVRISQPEADSTSESPPTAPGK